MTNQTAKNASGSTFSFATVTIGGVEYTCPIFHGWDGSAVQRVSVDSSGRLNINNAQIGGNAVSTGNGASGTGVQRVTLADDSTGRLVAMSEGITVSVDITRPSNTTAYTAGDALSNSASAPTTGGFTFTSAARASGKRTMLADMVIASSNVSAALQGEIWIFDTAVTNINDNSAFAVSDSEIKTLVAKVPFGLAAVGNNSAVHLPNLGMVIDTSGSADLRFLVRVVNDYSPASAEVLTVRAKFVYMN
jgi:hypothetical protein